MFDRVMVTGDLLRPFPDGLGGWESATRKNVRWLWSLVGAAAAEAGRDARMLAWDGALDGSEGGYVHTPDLYRAAGVELSPDGWARLCGAAAPLPEDAWAPLLDAVAGALVVAYELPDSMVGALARAGVPFIDVIAHPVRFLDDLVFALRTNVPAIHRLLVAHQVAEGAIRQQAALIRAKAAWLPKPLALPPGAALVLGQVAGDRALVLPGGGQASLGDHMDRLHRLCLDHPLVLFKPHPYDRPDSPSQRAVAALPAIRRVEANFYHLLCQPELERVVALNSSGVTEAGYFGKAAEALIPALYAFGTRPPAGDGMPGAPVPVDGRWIEPWFWRAVLDDAPAEPPARPAPANRLRRTMNADWGYGFIEQVVA